MSCRPLRPAASFDVCDDQEYEVVKSCSLTLEIMQIAVSDPVLKTLLLPLESGLLDLPIACNGLFLRARQDRKLDELAVSELTCEQSFAPDKNALMSAGRNVHTEVKGNGFDLVLILPTRQRLETRTLLARAVSQCRPGGFVVACNANTEGAKTVEADLKKICGLDRSLSKNKCRVFWAKIQPDIVNDGLLSEWLTLDAPRPILDGTYLSRPGLFAWDRIDPASKLLAAHLPHTLAGRGADLGAGYGYLARTVLEKAPAVTGMDLYEAEKRALDLAEENLSAFRGKRVLTGVWSDVTQGIEGPYDFVVSNPPFHQTGKTERIDVGQAFIAAAAKGLRKGGSFYLVANRHLPYEQSLKAAFGTVDMLADKEGFKVIKAIMSKKN